MNALATRVGRTRHACERVRHTRWENASCERVGRTRHVNALIIRVRFWGERAGKHRVVKWGRFLSHLALHKEEER